MVKPKKSRFQEHIDDIVVNKPPPSLQGGTEAIMSATGSTFVEGIQDKDIGTTEDHPERIMGQFKYYCSDELDREISAPMASSIDTGFDFGFKDSDSDSHNEIWSGDFETWRGAFGLLTREHMRITGSRKPLSKDAIKHMFGITELHKIDPDAPLKNEEHTKIMKEITTYKRLFWTQAAINKRLTRAKQPEGDLSKKKWVKANEILIPERKSSRFCAASGRDGSSLQNPLALNPTQTLPQKNQNQARTFSDSILFRERSLSPTVQGAMSRNVPVGATVEYPPGTLITMADDLASNTAGPP
jgi:hypothetical protein